MKKLFSYMKFYKINLTLGPLFKWFEAFLELLVPLVIAHMIDKGIRINDSNIILQDAFILFALSIMGIISALIAQFYAARASQGIGTKIRDDLFYHISHLSYKEFDEVNSSAFITRLNNDVNQIQIAIAMLIRLVVRAPFLVVGASVMAFLIDTKLSLIFFISLPILILIMYFIMHKSIPLYHKIQNKLELSSRKVKENLAGVRVIRSFSKQQEEKTQFKKTSNEILEKAIKVSKLSALLSPLTYTVVNLAIIAILYLGSIEINVGNLSTGQIIAFVNYMNQIVLALFVVANLVIIYTKANVSWKRILEIFAMQNTQVEINNEPNKKQSKSIIVFDHVSFKYGNAEKMTLENISFSINRNESIGIIGGTGSGKSTLINLIARNYDHSEGKIIYYEHPITSYKYSTIHKDIAIVPQKSTLFSGSIKENMLMANHNASDEIILEALTLSESIQFVDALPQRINTHCIRGGNNFSGGQKQRLCIARTLLQQASILILDDSSSALDYATDAKLRNNLNKLNHYDCIIYVSQRISSLSKCDRILVLDNGNCVGFDTHQNLLKNCHIYNEIYASQNKEDQNETI